MINNTHAHTPPRAQHHANDSHMARKRYRSMPADDDAAAPIPLTNTSAAATSLFHHGLANDNIMGNDTPASSSSLYSPSSHHRDHDAAAVSPFENRTLPAFTTASNNNSSNTMIHFTSPLLQLLEPVPEEEFTFSQSTIGTTSSSDGSGNSNAAMIGTIMDADDDIFVEQYQGELECYSSAPPTKRARMDSHESQYEPSHVLSQSTMEEDASMGIYESPKKTAMDHGNFMKQNRCSWNINNLKSGNVDRLNDDLCCHVCSLNATSANGKNANGIIAGTSTASCNTDSHHGGINNGGVPAPPRSHSLLTYFQRSTTKKQQLPAAASATCTAAYQQPHNATSKPPSLNSNATSLNPCRYCDKPICIACTKTCEHCLRGFCTFCTTVDYERSVVERILCFECDGAMARNCGSGEDTAGDCDMMDL